MKKLLLFAAVAALTTACVDKDYDLGNGELEDFEVGNSETEFRLPLATIHVKGDAIDGTYDSLENIFAEADEWIPLAEKYAAVPLTELSDPNSSYLNTLLDDLFAELQTNDTRREAVANRIDSQYQSSVRVPAELAAQGVSLKEYIYKYMVDTKYSGTIRSSIRDLASAHLESMTTCVDEISQDLDAFNITGDVMDALTENSSNMKIYGTALNVLPIDCDGDFSLRAKEDGKPLFSTKLDLGYNKTEAIDAPIDGDGLRGLAEEMSLNVTFSPRVYYPRKPRPGSSDNAVEMVLKLYKKGGLSFN